MLTATETLCVCVEWKWCNVGWKVQPMYRTCGRWVHVFPQPGKYWPFWSVCCRWAAALCRCPLCWTAGGWPFGMWRPGGGRGTHSQGRVTSVRGVGLQAINLNTPRLMTDSMPFTLMPCAFNCPSLELPLKHNYVVCSNWEKRNAMTSNPTREGMQLGG